MMHILIYGTAFCSSGTGTIWSLLGLTHLLTIIYFMVPLERPKRKFYLSSQLSALRNLEKDFTGAINEYSVNGMAYADPLGIQLSGLVLVEEKEDILYSCGIVIHCLLTRV